jgi:TIR domain
MRIFLSYASEDVGIAERIAAALKVSGHSVFFDKLSLRSGYEYDTAIRAEVDRSDAYIFLISDSSIASGRYTLTELKFAEKRFPNPSGRVLPVMLSSVDWARIPPYLTSVTILGLRGNASAEVVAAIAHLRSRRYSFAQIAIAVASSAAITALSAAVVIGNWPRKNSVENVRISSGGFGWSPIYDSKSKNVGVKLNSVWAGARSPTNLRKIEVRVFDAQLNQLRKWELSKEVLVTVSGSWALPNDFEARRDGPETFIDACFHAAKSNGEMLRSVGYLRAFTSLDDSGNPFELVDRDVRTALTAKTDCDYVL